MKKEEKLRRKLLSFLLTLALVIGLMPGMSLTAYAADEVSENISLVASNSANLETISGTHYSVSCGYMVADDKGMTVNSFGALTINARKGETITKVILSYSEGGNRNTLSASIGTFDGNSTITGINAQQVSISSSSTAGVKISSVRVYFEGNLNNPTVTLTGGANAKNSGGLLTQSYLPGAMDTVTYTALTGAAFPAFENFTQNGVTVERTSDTVVTISGTPTANTAIIVPDAVSSSKIVTWNSATISSISSTITQDYTYTANGITLNKTGKGKFANNSISGYDSTASFEFTTATGKFTNIEIAASAIYRGGNWTTVGNTLKWNGTPSNSVSLSGVIAVEGVSSINFVIEMPTVAVTITPGSNMTKTTDSGEASQSDLSGAMTDVVYTADNGYYFPEDYSVAAVNGISVTRNSYTQITVSGTPTADAAIALTAPTAKATPDAPTTATTTATATECTTEDNNDGKLTGVTTAMEYKKSDADSWTDGTGSDITGLVPGTYYVRVKGTETTNASTNQKLTIKGFISYTVTFKVVNGKWNEGEGDAATADKIVTLTGHDGDTLKLTADQIPAVGTKPNDTYKAGSWDTTPSAETEITAVTTYTYTYAAKEASVVTKVPEAKTLTYNGSAQALANAGEATGGEMQYALGTKAVATEPYTTSIPTATDIGTYYVWYKVVGDSNHNNTEAASLEVGISKAAGTISYATTAVTKTYGDASFTNALTNTGDGSVAYASDNTSVATVDSTGKVTIKGAGTVKITATVTDSDTYTYATKTASYMLTVNVNTYTVTFNANGQGTAPAAQTVAENATATKPTDPTATGYAFGGWYTEVACTNAYDFSTAVTADITLYAKWTASGTTSTEVVPKTPDTPVPTVTGMEAVASAAITAEEQSKVASGEINVDVKLEVEKKDEAALEGAQEVKNLVASGNSVTMFLDLSLFKYVTTTDNGSTATTNIGSSNSVVLRVQIPYDTARQNIQILRYHNAIAQAFTKLNAEPTEGYADGTYFVGNGFVALYASGFSTYAIADSGYAQPEKQTEKQPETITYSSIRISKVKHTKNKLKLTWDMVPGAEGYDIFASFCGSPDSSTPVMTVSTTSAIIKKVHSKTGLKKVDRGCIKYLIKAYKTVNGQKSYIAESYLNHSAGVGHRKYSDAKKITTKKSNYTLTVGKSAKGIDQQRKK